MVQYFYSRESVPVGQVISLETQFKDAAGNAKDTDSFPLVEITDASTSVVVASTSSGVLRTGIGRYRFDLLVPSGLSAGLWNDSWSGSVDGYLINSTFDFLVDSIGSIDAVGAIIEPDPEIGDDPEIVWTIGEIKGINILLKILQAKIQNIKYDENGGLCPVFSIDQLVTYLCASLSELNATPTITGYTFDSPYIQTTWSDIITQGAYLISFAAKATHEAGKEFVLTDNGVTINPPQVSSTMLSLYNSQLSDYRAKLKEIKRNHRPVTSSVSAGSLINNRNPAVTRLRHRREGQII